MLTGYVQEGERASAHPESQIFFADHEKSAESEQ
jgi:hypothetical protein